MSVVHGAGDSFRWRVAIRRDGFRSPLRVGQWDERAKDIMPRLYYRTNILICQAVRYMVITRPLGTAAYAMMQQFMASARQVGIRDYADVVYHVMRASPETWATILGRRSLLAQSHDSAPLSRVIATGAGPLRCPSPSTHS